MGMRNGAPAQRSAGSGRRIRGACAVLVCALLASALTAAPVRAQDLPAQLSVTVVPPANVDAPRPTGNVVISLNDRKLATMPLIPGTGPLTAITPLTAGALSVLGQTCGGQLLGRQQLRGQRRRHGDVPDPRRGHDHGEAEGHRRTRDRHHLAGRRRALRRRRERAGDLRLQGPGRSLGGEDLLGPGRHGQRHRHVDGGHALVHGQLRGRARATLRRRRRRSRSQAARPRRRPRPPAAARQRRRPRRPPGPRPARRPQRCRRRTSPRPTPSRPTSPPKRSRHPWATTKGSSTPGGVGARGPAARRDEDQARRTRVRALRPALGAREDRRDPRRGVHAAADRHRGRRGARDGPRRRRRGRLGQLRKLGQLRRQGQGRLQAPGELRLRGGQRRASRGGRRGGRDRGPVEDVELARHPLARRARRGDPGAARRRARRCSRG